MVELNAIISFIIVFIGFGIGIGVGTVILGNSTVNCSTLPADNTISNPNYNTIIATIALAATNQGIAYDSTHNRMYVAGFFQSNLKVIDVNTNTIIDTVSIGSNPRHIAFASSNNTLWVTRAGGTVAVINTTTNLSIANVTVGIDPYDIKYVASLNRMYVTNNGGNSVSVIAVNNNTVIATIPVISGPQGLEFASSNNTLYVLNNNPDTISIINTTTNTVIQNITNVDTGILIDIDYDPSRNRMYASNGDSGHTVKVINVSSASVITEISVPNSDMYGIIYSTPNDSMYVAAPSTDATPSIEVISASTLSIYKTINIIGASQPIFFAQALNNNIYMTSQNGQVYVVDTNPTVSSTNSWRATCESAQTQTQVAYALLVISLIVIAAVVIFVVLRELTT